jgi:hypothetical protein
VSNVTLDPESVVAEIPPASDPNAPVLAIPKGWVVDDLAQARLARQLTHAPSRIQGVAAETGALPPGTSFRVHAERLCLRPLSVADETSSRVVQGAALLRPGVAFEARDGGVEIEPGPLLVDPGAHVHDPWRRVAPIEHASALGRPPFPRRPVVVFLACEPDVEVTDWARSLVNNLVRRDVEGRLAMLDVADGLHLTQPCLPSEESIRSLSPDVIVALDHSALEQASAWCGANRSAVAMEFTPDVAATAELVSWRLGQAQGRLRARIGRRMNAPSLVSLVNRLCSGPHPAPPSDATGPGAAVATVRALFTDRPAPTTGPVTTRSVVVVTEDGNDEAHPLGGLVDHLVATGHRAQTCPIESCKPDAVRAADVVVVSSPMEAGDLSDVLEDRARAGKPTIAAIEATDVSTKPDGIPHLAAAPAQLAGSAGSAVTGSTLVHAVVTELGIRGHLLPPLLTRARAADLRSERRGHNRFSDPVIGWLAGSTGAPLSDYGAAVAEAVLAVLEGRNQLRVEIVGETSHLPAGFLAHPRVSLLRDRPDAEVLSHWAVHVWTPPLLDDGVADDTRSFVEVSGIGVPTVLPEPVQRAVGGYPPPGLLVQDFRQADDWIAPLGLLLDNEVSWSRQSRAAIRRFDTMHSAAASAVTVNRFLGWALYKGDRR